MPSTGTRKKNNTAGRKTTRKKNPSVKKRQRQAYNRELVTEITILIALAVSVLLVISNFDIGGKVGTVISQFFFGLFGWMAYPDGMPFLCIHDRRTDQKPPAVRDARSGLPDPGDDRRTGVQRRCDGNGRTAG